MATRTYKAKDSNGNSIDPSTCDDFTCAGFSSSMTKNDRYYCTGHRSYNTNEADPPFIPIEQFNVEDYEENGPREPSGGRPPDYVLKYDQLENIRLNLVNEIAKRRTSPLYNGMSLTEISGIKIKDLVEAKNPKDVGMLMNAISEAINNISYSNPVSSGMTMIGDYDHSKEEYPTDEEPFERAISQKDPLPDEFEDNHLVEASDLGELEDVAVGGKDRKVVKIDPASMSGRVQDIFRGCICHSDCFEFWFEETSTPIGSGCAHTVRYEGVSYSCGCNYGVAAWGGCSWMVYYY